MFSVYWELFLNAKIVSLKTILWRAAYIQSKILIQAPIFYGYLFNNLIEHVVILDIHMKPIFL